MLEPDPYSTTAGRPVPQLRCGADRALYRGSGAGGGGMRLLRSIALAFSMFSHLPVPKVAWSEENRRGAICALPLVGVVIGAGICLWAWLMGALGCGPLLRAAGFTLLPVIITGGIHLDGFGDTLDALASQAPPERKREILKDPRAGIFAVIGVAGYLLLYLALCTELPPGGGALLLLGLIHVQSRIWCALAVVAFKPSGGEGLLRAMRAPAGGRRAARFLLGLLLLCAVAMLLLDRWAAATVLAAGFISARHVLVMSRRQFGGMSGDLAGYLLQLGELSMLAALVLVGKLV